MAHNQDVATDTSLLTMSQVQFVVPRAEFDLNLSYGCISLTDNLTNHTLSLHSMIPVVCEPDVYVSLILKEKLVYKNKDHSIIIARFNMFDRGICKTSMSDKALEVWGITREELTDVQHKLFVRMFRDFGGWLSLGGPLKMYMPGEYTSKTCAKDGLIDGVTAQWFVSTEFIEETVNVKYVGQKPSQDEAMGQLVPLSDGILFLTSNCHSFYLAYKQIQGGTEVMRLRNIPWFVELTLFLTHNRSDRLCLRVNNSEAYSLNKFMAIKIAAFFSDIQSIDVPVMAAIGSEKKTTETDIALKRTAELDLSPIIDGGNNNGQLNTITVSESDKDGRDSSSVVEQQSKDKMASFNKDTILKSTFLLRVVKFVYPPDNFGISLSHKKMTLTNNLDETIECPLIDVSAVITVPREQFYYTFFPIKNSIKHKGVVYNLLIARSQMCERGTWTTSIPKEILKYLAMSSDLLTGYKYDVLGRMLSHLSLGSIETHTPGAYSSTSCNNGVIDGVTAFASRSADTCKLYTGDYQYFGSAPTNFVDEGRLMPLRDGLLFCTDDSGLYITYSQIEGGTHIGQVSAKHAYDDLSVFLSRDGVDNISFRIPDVESKSLAAFFVTKRVREPTLLANHKSLQSTPPSELFSIEQRQMLKSVVNAARGGKLIEPFQHEESLLTSDVSSVTFDTTDETDNKIAGAHCDVENIENADDGEIIKRHDDDIQKADCDGVREEFDDEQPFIPMESEPLAPHESTSTADNPFFQLTSPLKSTLDMEQQHMPENAVDVAEKHKLMDNGEVQYFQLPEIARSRTEIDQETSTNAYDDHLAEADQNDARDEDVFPDETDVGDGDHDHGNQSVRSTCDVTNGVNEKEMTIKRRGVDLQDVKRDTAQINGGLDRNNQVESKANSGDKHVRPPLLKRPDPQRSPTTSLRRSPVGTQKRIKRTPATKITHSRTSMLTRSKSNKLSIEWKYGENQQETRTAATVSRSNFCVTPRSLPPAIPSTASIEPTVDCQNGGGLGDINKLAAQQPGGSKHVPVVVDPKLNVLRKICSGQFDFEAIPRSISRTVERNKMYQDLLNNIVHIWSNIHTQTDVNGDGPEVRDDPALDVEVEDKETLTQLYGNYATRGGNTRQSAKRVKHMKNEQSSSGQAIPLKRRRLSRKAKKSSTNDIDEHEHGGSHHNNANVQQHYDRRGTAIKNHVLRDQIEEWGLTGKLWKQFGKEKQAALRELSSARIHIGYSPNSYRVTNSVYQYVVNQADVNRTADAKAKRVASSTKSRLKRMAKD